jgi:hypothetical protein
MAKDYGEMTIRLKPVDNNDFISTQVQIIRDILPVYIGTHTIEFSIVLNPFAVQIFGYLIIGDFD